MADDNKNKNKSIMTPKFRVSFPFVFQPQKAKEEGKDPKYSVAMLFEKGADLSALKTAAKEAAANKWGPDPAKWPKNLRNPFRDQGDREKKLDGYVDGAIVITATSKQRPGLVDENVQPIIEERQFYPGCYARATVRAFAYDTAGNKGVSFGLQNIQKVADGQPLGGRSRPENDFAPVEGTGTPDTSADELFG